MESNKKEVFLIAATSEDSFISPSGKEALSSTKWTSSEDTQFFSEKTKEAGVVIYGSKTFQTIPARFRPLKDRLNIVLTKNPDKFSEQVSDQLIATSDSPKQIISNLWSKGFRKIAICGGHSIYELFINSGVVDKVYQTIEPIQFGEGIPFLSDLSKSLLKKSLVIPLSETTKVIVYDVIK